MNLIAEIIQNLSSDNPNLTNALTKTKVLLHKLGQKGLAKSWVNKELNGYGDDDELPSYRILNAEPKCNWMGVGWNGNEQPLPLGNNLSEKERDNIKYFRVGGSISTVENTLNGTAKGNRIIANIPPEYFSRLSEVFTSGTHIINAWQEVGIHQFSGLLTEVRSRLLDFVLNLQDEFGEESTDDEIEQKSKTVDTLSMFNDTVFKGSNITFIIGDHSTQNVSNIQVNNGDFGSLATALRELGIEQADIDNLNQCIEGDGTLENQQLGEQVDGWCKGMFRRIIDGAWTIEMHTASAAIYNALKNFYGW